MKALKAWMGEATRTQQETLARLAGTSRGHLYQLSNGLRKAGPALARRLEIAAKRMNTTLDRRDICEACGRCEFAKRARR